MLTLSRSDPIVSNSSVDNVWPIQAAGQDLAFCPRVYNLTRLCPEQSQILS